MSTKYTQISTKKKTLPGHVPSKVFYIFNSQSMSPPAHAQEMFGSPLNHRMAPAAPIRKPITPPAAQVSR